VELHQALGEREADAEPTLRLAARLLVLDEEVENPGQEVGSNADSVVVDADHDVVRFTTGRDRDVAVGLRVLRGIREQVRKHLRQATAIGLDLQPRWWNVEGQLVTAFDEFHAFVASSQHGSTRSAEQPDRLLEGRVEEATRERGKHRHGPTTRS
jgi:hypothetical protein